MTGDYQIELRDDAQPFASHSPSQECPTGTGSHGEGWGYHEGEPAHRVVCENGGCAQANGKVRICVDLSKLNESVKRERHPLPVVEQTLAQSAGAKLFMKLDANSEFWQIPLALASSLLTTFITPFGSYRCNRLLFGISSAPEHFQRRMSEALTGLAGTVCMMDDILIHGATWE